MADSDIRKLLDYIIANPVARTQTLSEELKSSALEPGEQIRTNIAHEVQTEREAAARMGADFVKGMRAAAATRRSGGPLVLDDSSPAQDAMISALVRFLVRPDLAAVETTELGNGHYRYSITVDWPAMERTAQMAGVNLSTALS